MSYSIMLITTDYKKTWKLQQPIENKTYTKMLPSLGFQMQQTVPDCDFWCQNYCLISGVRKIGHVGL